MKNRDPVTNDIFLADIHLNSTPDHIPESDQCDKDPDGVMVPEIQIVANPDPERAFVSD